MTKPLAMSQQLFNPVNQACKSFTFQTKEIATNLNEKLFSEFKPDQLTKQLGDQFQAFLGTDQDAYDWTNPIVDKSSDCQTVDLSFPAVSQTNKAAQGALTFNANKNCAEPNSPLKDACFTLTKPDGSSHFCSLTSGCKTTDAAAPSISPAPVQTDANSAPSTSTSSDAATSSNPSMVTDNTQAAPPPFEAAPTTVPFDAAAEAANPTTTPAPNATPDSQTPQTPNSPNNNASTTPTDVWGLTKVGGGSIATLFFAYKAIREGHKWCAGSDQKQKMHLPMLAEGRTIESMADATQKNMTAVNSGWRTLAYSTAAAASLVFTVASL